MNPFAWSLLSFRARNLLLAVLLIGAHPLSAAGEAIDFGRARDLFQKRQRGETLTSEEQAYVMRAMAARKEGAGKEPGRTDVARKDSSTPVSDPTLVSALVPLDELVAGYKGEDGGLYGGGSNTPPPAHRDAYLAACGRVEPLDVDGRPSRDGRVVLLSIGMSNTTMEFSEFKRRAEADSEKSPRVVIVDGAKGARTGIAWSLDGLEWLPAGEEQRLQEGLARAGLGVRKGFGDTWAGAEAKLRAEGVSPRQVQVLWIKQAEARPASLGEFPAHARVLQASLVNILNIARRLYPNLRVAYLSSRIFGGYATTTLNPEPYAYEEAFAVRWVITGQVGGEPRLNFDPSRGEVRAPVVVWGPYLWANGPNPRRSDGLTWAFDDFVASDRTHPDTVGRRKVADLLLRFLKSDEGARRWFTSGAGPEAARGK